MPSAAGAHEIDALHALLTRGPTLLLTGAGGSRVADCVDKSLRQLDKAGEHSARRWHDERLGVAQHH